MFLSMTFELVSLKNMSLRFNMKVTNSKIFEFTLLQKEAASGGVLQKRCS